MEISARSYLTAGVSLTAAAAIAFMPLALPVHHQPVPIPNVAVPELQLAVSPADIRAFIAGMQSVLDGATMTVVDLAGVPGQSLIGVVDNIVALIDNTFTGLIDATDNQTLAASLTILKTLSVDAFAKLAENLGRINTVVTTTTAQVGDLLTSALTGSLQNVLLAVVNLVNDPLAFANYAGLLAAGVGSGQLLAGNGLEAVQNLAGAGLDVTGIALSEVTFQFNNAVSGLSALSTQLGDASGSALVEAVVGAVQGLAIAPAVAVFNLGSGVIGAVLTTAHAGLDAVFGGAVAAVGAAPLEPAGSVTTLAALNTAVATAVSGLLGAVPPPAGMAALAQGPVEGINGPITVHSDSGNDGFDTAGGLVDDEVASVHNVSEDQESTPPQQLGDNEFQAPGVEAGFTTPPTEENIAVPSDAEVPVIEDAEIEEPVRESTVDENTDNDAASEDGNEDKTVEEGGPAADEEAPAEKEAAAAKEDADGKDTRRHDSADGSESNDSGAN